MKKPEFCISDWAKDDSGGWICYVSLILGSLPLKRPVFIFSPEFPDDFSRESAIKVCKHKILAFLSEARDDLNSMDLSNETI